MLENDFQSLWDNFTERNLSLPAGHFSNADTFLPVGRQLFDGETEQLNRSGAEVLFPTNTANEFDLATTTIACLNRLYFAINATWAEAHPLIKSNVTLLNIQKQYRAFHRYSIDLLKRIIFNPLINQLVNPDQKSSKTGFVSANSLNGLRESLRSDLARTMNFRRLSTQLESEMGDLQRQIDDVLDRISNENRDPDIAYLSQVVQNKRKRLSIMQAEIARIEKNAKIIDQQFESNLVRVLDESIYEINELRAASERSKTLFQGVKLQQQLQYVTPYDVKPGELLHLYESLYNNLHDVTVRSILSQAFRG